MQVPVIAYIVAGCVVAGVLGGWTVRDWKADADALAAVRKTERIQAQMQAKIDAKATEFEAFRATIEPARVESRNTIREIFRDVPVRADCAPPAGAVSLLDGLVARANSASSGQSGVTMSAPVEDTDTVR